MRQNTFTPTGDSPTLSRVVFLLALAQCFLSAIPHLTAMENLTYYPLLACLAFGLATRRIGVVRIREPLAVSILALSLIFLVVSALGPYPTESLNAIRKDLMPAVVVFLALLWTVESRAQVRFTMLVVIAGVTLRLLLIVVERWVLHRSLLDNHPGFVDPYAGGTIPSAFYSSFPLLAAPVIPFGAALLLQRDLSTWQRLLVGATLAGSVMLIVDYGSRAPVIAMVGGLLVLPFFFGFRRRVLFIVASLGTLSALFAVWQEPQVVNRYLSIIESETYTNEGAEAGEHSSVFQRKLIRRGVVEIANQRPISGYGYGWKKLSMVVADGQFLQRWKADPSVDPQMIAYFSRGYGGINPHNLAVQLYFEGGALGILAFVGMLAAMAYRLVALYRRNALHDRDMVALATAFVVTWLLSNVANSLWSDQKLPFVVLAIIATTWHLSPRVRS